MATRRWRVGRLPLLRQRHDSTKTSPVESIAKLAHERREARLAGAVAWRDTLQELMGTRWSDLSSGSDYAPERFTSRVYQDVVAGKPRLSGARAGFPTEPTGLP